MIAATGDPVMTRPCQNAPPVIVRSTVSLLLCLQGLGGKTVISEIRTQVATATTWSTNHYTNTTCALFLKLLATHTAHGPAPGRFFPGRFGRLIIAEDPAPETRAQSLKILKLTRIIRVSCKASSNDFPSASSTAYHNHHSSFS